jgi:hypothetical protein
VAFDTGLSWAFTAIGVTTQAGALLLARRPIRLLRAGGRASGTLVDGEKSMILGSRGPAQPFYFPLVSFTTPQGERICFKSSVGQRAAPARGNDVHVLFDPAKPHDAELASFKALWLFPTVTALLGLPFLAAGVAGLL